MTQDIYPVPAEWQARAKVDANAYAETYARSLSDPEAYWLEQAQRLDWVQLPSVADESSFAELDFGVRWFGDGVMNVSVNCLDRHLAERGDDIALNWEHADSSEAARRSAYREFPSEVCRYDNLLTATGVKKG